MDNFNTESHCIYVEKRRNALTVKDLVIWSEKQQVSFQELLTHIFFVRLFFFLIKCWKPGEKKKRGQLDRDDMMEDAIQ